MSAAVEWLATLLDEANHAPSESVQSALAELEGAAPHPRLRWLVGHLGAIKREQWTLIAAATGGPPPPETAALRELMRWEVEQARQLAPEHLDCRLNYRGAELTVAELLRLSARHSVWHAGQIAALAGRVRSV